ncbi:hypothetical protein [Chitinasiproducens palmae]|uniref:Uncharacterized protein n=1 Tax=Chitinasiproducens palmae TaxID=1770053 RepID=A0A1H2PQR9_9BURK|nr:hypothetical protein [Chitinasiproducens palmae]SDV49186.1 hypothetical protein SAMN05216551_107137 [Chitinasiproducens palmae]
MAGVRIPIYDERVSAGGNIPGAPMQAVRQEGLGQELQQAGQAGFGLAAAVHIQEQEDGRAWAAKTAGEFQLSQIERMRQQQDSAAPGAADFTPNFLKGYDEDAATALLTAPTPTARKFLEASLTSQRTSLGGQAINWQATQQRDYNVSQYQDGSNAAARIVAMDPSQYDQQRAQQTALLQSSVLPPDIKAKLGEHSRDVLATAAGTAALNADPASAYAALTSPLDKAPQWVRDLPPQKLVMLQQHAGLQVQRQANAAETQRIAAENASTDAYNASFDLIDKGLVPSPAMQQDAIAKATAVGPQEVARVRELFAAGAARGGFASMSYDQRQQEVARESGVATTPGQGVDTTEAKVLASRRGINDAIATEVKTNPWAAAQERGVTKNAPVAQISSVDDALSVVRSRAGAQGVVEAWAGPSGYRVSPFQPQEASQLADVLQALPPDQRGTAISQLGREIGDPGRAAALAKQFGEKNRPLYLQLMAGSINATTRGGEPVATLIGRGVQALSDKTAGMDDKAQQGVRAQIAQQVRGTFASGTQDQDSIDAAYYIYAGLSARDKTAPATVNADNVRTAVDAATGGVVAFNGKQTATPYGWDERRFTAAVKAVDPTSIATDVSDGKVHIGGSTVTVPEFLARVPSAKLVRVTPTGGYVVQAGNGYVTNSQRQPIVVRLK